MAKNNTLWAISSAAEVATIAEVLDIKFGYRSDADRVLKWAEKQIAFYKKVLAKAEAEFVENRDEKAYDAWENLAVNLVLVERKIKKMDLKVRHPQLVNY